MALFLTPKMSGYSALNVADLTEVEFVSRDVARKGLTFFRENVPGFERAWILDTASQVGTRHARRLVGAERITIDHWRNDGGYLDSIGLCPGMTPSYPTLQIPYRSLLPASTNGLLAAGRNLSADTASHAALREIPECWVMGEAAGVAATLAVDSGVDVRDIDIRALQAQLVKQGGIVDRPTQPSQDDAQSRPRLRTRRVDPLASGQRGARVRVMRRAVARWVRFADPSGRIGFGTVDEGALTPRLSSTRATCSAAPSRPVSGCPSTRSAARPPCQPTKMIGLWNNLRAAADKQGWAAPAEPLYFLKPPSSVVGHGAPVVRPSSYSGRILYEGELGVVIGTTCVDVAIDDVDDVVFGYTCVNDVTALDLHHRGRQSFPQWCRAKGFDTFGADRPGHRHADSIPTRCRCARWWAARSARTIR